MSESFSVKLIRHLSEGVPLDEVRVLMRILEEYKKDCEFIPDVENWGDAERLDNLKEITKWLRSIGFTVSPPTIVYPKIKKSGDCRWDINRNGKTATLHWADATKKFFILGRISHPRDKNQERLLLPKCLTWS